MRTSTGKFPSTNSPRITLIRLAIGLCYGALALLYYGINPFEALLTPLGVEAHFSLPKTVDQSWKAKTRPSILATKCDGIGPQKLLTLVTSRGTIEARAYLGNGPLGVVEVCGYAHGYRGPANGLYDKLARSLQNNQGVSTLHIKYRRPGSLDDCIHDTRAATAYLTDLGCKRIVLIGHSFGGAVAIASAAFEENSVGVVALSTQAEGANLVNDLGDRKLLVIHGAFDPLLPPVWAKTVYREAHGPKEFKLVASGHMLDLCSNEVFNCVYPRVVDWLRPSNSIWQENRTLTGASKAVPSGARS